MLEDHVEEDTCEEQCDESGCTPGSHACSCCMSLRVAPAEQRVSVPAAAMSGELERSTVADAARPGFTRRLMRPPAA